MQNYSWVGQITQAEKVEDSNKLLRLQVDFGDENRQVISGIAKYYSTEELLNKKLVFVTNLAVRKIMGLESQAMILAADVGGSAVCLQPDKDVPAGTIIR